MAKCELRDVISTLAVIKVILDFSILYPLKPLDTAHRTFSLVAQLNLLIVPAGVYIATKRV